jgi:hypothetical protein
MQWLLESSGATSRYEQLEELIPGTGDWFFELGAYDSWYRGSTNLFWVYVSVVVLGGFGSLRVVP